MFTRSLPLLLIGFMFLFINAEAWQSAGELEPALLFTIITAFATFAGIFLGTQIPKELRAQLGFATPEEVVAIADDAPVGDPLDGTDQQVASQLCDPPPLSRRERANLWLIAFVTQGFRLLLVSVLIGLVFVGIGLLMIRPETIALWTGRAPVIWWDLPWDLFGNDIAITTQLLQVSAFLGAFAAVYFSVYAATDKTLRTEFFDDTLSEIRQNLAARSIYRAQLSANHAVVTGDPGRGNGGSRHSGRSSGSSHSGRTSGSSSSESRSAEQ